MRRCHTAQISLFALALGLTACASVATRLPDISLPDLTAEQVTQEDLAMTDLQTQSARLIKVAYPIMKANVDLCPKTRADIGVWVHESSDYDKRLRAASTRSLGTTDRKTVFQIAPNSPAALAGLKRGDEILNAEGEAIGPSDKSWDAEIMSGQVTTLTIRRADTLLTKSITAEQVCDYDVTLRSSAAINAYADGRGITMTTGMMNFVENDNELALIVGHELAHNTMGHIRKIIGNIILSGGATRYTRPFESEADYVGLYYSVRAGFSPVGVEDFWRRLAKVNPKSVARAKTHPTFPDRYLRLAAAREEIVVKQAAGEALVPNFKEASE